MNRRHPTHCSRKLSSTNRLVTFLVVTVIGMLCILVAQPTTAQSNSVNITSNGYVPIEISVTIGSTVTWTNTDEQAHKVISNLFDSNIIPPHTTFSYTFNDPGNFRYHDSNPRNTGTVNVG